MKEKSNYRWTWGFFGLPPNYNFYLHSEIFDLIHHGGFSHDDIYKMPKHMRTFYRNKLAAESKKAQAGAQPPEQEGNIRDMSPLNKDGTIKKWESGQKIITPIKKSAFPKK